MKNRQSIAMALASARKKKMMFKGGQVDPDFDADAGSDLDQDADRTLGELAAQGAFRENEISNPQSQDEDRMIAKALFRRAESEEMGYAMGGLVQPEHGMPMGNKPNEDMMSETSESLSSELMKPAELGHPQMSVTEEAMRMIEEKRKRRRFS